MKGKKGLLALGIIAVIVIAVLFFLASNLDAIVKKGIEKYGSIATGTAVRVSSVSIKLKGGAGSIRGLSIGNPTGFSTPSLFDLKDITVDIDTGSVTKEPIIIEKIHILAPYVVYEINESGKSNIDEIKKNLGASQKEGESSGKENSGKEKKIIIRDLIIEKGEVEVLVAALQDKPTSTALPLIHLKNLGGEGGSTPSEIALQILKPLADGVAKAAMDTGVQQYLGKSTEDVKRMVEEKARGKLGTMGGESEKGAEKALKNLLGR